MKSKNILSLLCIAIGQLWLVFNDSSNLGLSVVVVGAIGYATDQIVNVIEERLPK